jgi:hypothetical protein
VLDDQDSVGFVVFVVCEQKRRKFGFPIGKSLAYRRSYVECELRSGLYSIHCSILLNLTSSYYSTRDMATRIW